MASAVLSALDELVAVLPPPRDGLPRAAQFSAAVETLLAAWLQLRTAVAPEALTEAERTQLSRQAGAVYVNGAAGRVVEG